MSGSTPSLLRRLAEWARPSTTTPRERPDVVHARQVQSSLPTLQFFTVLGLASLIASLGILADSAVTVIGAMLIAPLMKPIVATSYGITIGDGRLVARGAAVTLLGIGVTVLVAVVTEHLFELRGPTEQLLSRTQPTLLDLAVAVAAGVAATMAVTRPDVTEALPGVAVAVALVPPLCATGVSLSLTAWPLAIGSAFLFAVNLLAIVLSGSLVLLLEGYGRLRLAGPGLGFVALCLLLTSIPLKGAMRRMQIDDRAEQTVVRYLRAHYATHGAVHPNDVRRVSTEMFDDHVFVFVEIESPAGKLDERAREDIYAAIARELDRPLNLRVLLSLTEQHDLYRYEPKEGLPEYGVNAPVARR